MSTNTNATAAPAVESKVDAPPAPQPAPKQDAPAPAQQTAPAPETPPASSAKPAAATTAAEPIVLTTPEGVDVTPEVLNIFAESARASGLTSEAAQSVMEGVVSKLAGMHASQVESVQKKWAEDVKADPTIGGNNLQQTLSIAKKVVETYGDQELSELLDKSGFRNHPAVLRFMRKAGASLREDIPVRGAGATVETDIAKRLFPSFK